MDTMDKVTMPDGVTYSPYTTLKKPDLRNQPPANVVSMTLKSIVVETVTGRRVFIPRGNKLSSNSNINP